MSTGLEFQHNVAGIARNLIDSGKSSAGGFSTQLQRAVNVQLSTSIGAERPVRNTAEMD